ncbi:hypothetical protein OAN307_c26430 [Octadecabacter antarcticus 307]|uniref:Uncharacterized protein n=1 Tax=Octadecabacter antarcticus 307 TaxID=391626 RepID=M9R7M9_9RHOB|nr:hypothetical protein [Octadecabacter antarcticus]AGI68232.1 hypothetical protein OAN307_c26430 [Octadecabacter antarcticus 307]
MNKSVKTNLRGQYNPFVQPMVTGHGVHGGPNGSIAYDDLVYEATRLTDDKERVAWAGVPKEQARWFMSSTLPSRQSADQVSDGEFVALVVDIDGGRATFNEVERAVLATTGGAVALVYSTKSATFAMPRWRVVIPLERSLSGADYADTAQAFYVRIREASEGRIDPDNAGARPGQISFLPNAPSGDPDGDDYLAFAAEIGEDPDLALDLTDDHPIVQLREAKRLEKQYEAEAAAERAKRRRGGGSTLITRFNAHHSVDELLSRYGYEQAEDASGRWPKDHWRSPYQTSGSFATRVYRDDDEGGETWVSLSGSDAKRGLGAKSANGGARYGDAFDLFVHFSHGGDNGAALKAWKIQCDDKRNIEVGHGLARRREQLVKHHDRLRALGREPSGVKAKDTSGILKTLRGLGRRGDEETRK